MTYKPTVDFYLEEELIHSVETTPERDAEMVAAFHWKGCAPVPGPEDEVHDAVVFYPYPDSHQMQTSWTGEILVTLAIRRTIADMFATNNGTRMITLIRPFATVWTRNGVRGVTTIGANPIETTIEGDYPIPDGVISERLYNKLIAQISE